MVASACQKLSEIMKEMAWTVLRDPAQPSSEAAHAALLLAHVAWNRSLGEEVSAASYRQVLARLEESFPPLWRELKGTDPEKMIESLVALKQARYPLDDRVIVVCGMRQGNVHVEWQDGQDVRDAHQTVQKHLRRLVELAMIGDEEEAVRHLGETAGLSNQEARQKVRELRRLFGGGR
jgi:hypothetical protein